MKLFNRIQPQPKQRKPRWQRPTIMTLTDEELLQRLGPAQAGSLEGDGGAFGIPTIEDLALEEDN